MSANNSPEEIFRFSVVRNPQPAGADARKDGVIQVVGSYAERTHQKYGTLLALVRQGTPRKGIIAHAQRMISEPSFPVQLENLQTPIWLFTDRLYDLREHDAEAVLNLIREIFDGNVDAVAESLTADRVTIADSFILASVAPPPIAGLRGRLMRALRAIKIISRLSDDSELDSRVIKRLLKATLLLPSALFPLPPGRTEQDQNKAEYERRKKRLEQERGNAQKLLDQLGRNEATAEELTGALSEHLYSSLHNGQSGEDRTVQPTGSVVLPRDRVERLSPAAKSVLFQELRMSADTIDVPFAVETLEKKNALLGHKVATDFRDVLADVGQFVFPSCGECDPVVLPEPKPENDFTPETRGEVELVGIQDLLLVRQRLHEYRAGEIAHIENVLQGERKAKKHRTLHRSEVTFMQETETEETVEKELQTTDKYELQTESSKVVQEDKSAEAGVTVTASYGSVDIEAHGNYANSSSTTESRQASATYARDVVSRSLQRIRERVLTRRSRTDITEVEVINDHEFDNREGNGHVTGIYRWVDKVYEAQIVNYGKRTMLEFMIPDPAAFHRYASTHRPSAGKVVPRPERPGFCRDGVFHPLTPPDLQPENYMCFVGKYNVSEVAAPSPRYVRVSDVLKFKTETTQSDPITFAEANDSFKVPEGYTPRAITYTITGGNSHSATTTHDDHDDIILAVVTIQNRKVFRYYKSEIGEVSGEDHWPDLTQVIEWDRPMSQLESQFGGYALGALSGFFPLEPASATPGDHHTVKVSLTGHTTLSMSVSIHYTVLCERTQARHEQWQIDTFNSIQQAYLNLKAEYDAAQESQEPVGLTTISGRNPLRNREIEQRELKKFAISLLTGQQFDSFNAMEVDYSTGLPQINLLDAAAEGKFVRFFEQALEWKHLTYLFYPYFWANKPNWTATVNYSDPDPLFEQFLQAGYARVWVPVRPGFDLVIAHYIKFGGEPWTEKDAPMVEESELEAPPALSMIEEMKEQLGNEFENRPGKIKVRKGKTLVTGEGTDLREDDVDREILIALQTFRIAAVDVQAQTLRLTEPYDGEDRDEIGFAIGVKFVGEPWLVPVPTTLVHLRAEADVITT